jgi:hypothetical protein
MSIDAMKQALEALDIVKIHFTQNRHVNDAITALILAIEQAERQEPVAYLNSSYEGDDLFTGKQLRDALAAQRQPLTEEEIVQVLGNVREGVSGNVFLAFARAIERKHGIGGEE